jgi:hypothetical protein
VSRPDSGGAPRRLQLEARRVDRLQSAEAAEREHIVRMMCSVEVDDPGTVEDAEARLVARTSPTNILYRTAPRLSPTEQISVSPRVAVFVRMIVRTTDRVQCWGAVIEQPFDALIGARAQDSDSLSPIGWATRASASG